jgi:3-dehydroquinate synthase
VENIVPAAGVISVDLGARSYGIVISDDLSNLSDAVAGLNPSSVAIITNPKINKFYGEKICAVINKPANTIIIPAGERYKTLSTIEKTLNKMLDAKMDRKSLVIALGGGVIGDMAGFAAACWQRGINFIQIPTSLLAMVDSSVGGKTGVNLPHGKNMVGAFKQPRHVSICPSFLKTLPSREIATGLAEVVKYGIIYDADFFSFIEENYEKFIKSDEVVTQHFIHRSCEIKARVVEADENEGGLRAILNFGHTVAHAVESATNYKTFTHGEAVSIGMVAAMKISCLLKRITIEDEKRVTNLLMRMGLPVHMPDVDLDVIMKLMTGDKKAVAGKVKFVLANKIGSVEYNLAVPDNIVKDALKEMQW